MRADCWKSTEWKIKFLPPSHSAKALWLSACLLFISCPLTPVVTHASCKRKPDHSSTWQTHWGQEAPLLDLRSANRRASQSVLVLHKSSVQWVLNTPPVLVPGCIVKPIYQDRGWSENVDIKTCRTHLLYHIAASALYMIFYHLTGRTLQSMLVIVYVSEPHSTGRDGWPGATSQLVSMSQQRSRQTESTDAVAESRCWRPESWLGWLEVVIGLMVMSAVVTLLIKRRLPPVQQCPGQGRMYQHIAAGRSVRAVLGQSGSEWRESPMQDTAVGGWAGGG